MTRYIAAIDQGTTSTRLILFDADGTSVAVGQKEHEQIFPKPGWVEHDANEIWRNTLEVAGHAFDQAGVTSKDIAAIGITNQRETTVLWDRRTGEPLHNALVWQDTRVEPLVREFAAAGGQDRFRAKTGLPLASYFSGLKLRWLLDNVPGARARAEAGELAFGTIDSWLIFNLTGGPDGGRHATDVTNASRTQLMDLETLAFDPDLLDAIGIPASVLPEILPSSASYGEASVEPLAGIPIAGVLGDQQAALVGQTCFEPGEAKNTYGTGCFLLLNTGRDAVQSSAGLLTTVAYRFGEAPAHYALEGSVAITGALVQWLRDNLGLIEKSRDIETLARQVDDNGDVYFVPAFSGLYAPHWDSSARGIIAGLTRYANKGHIARAALEATAFQTQEVAAAMAEDSGIALTELRVDGGMVANDLLMQFQADVLGVPVVIPKVAETTALGAAYAAGLEVGYWRDTDALREHWAMDRRIEPGMNSDRRARLLASWRRAVDKSRGWIE
ncbi:MAG TPA: glycerol kinase GlpK [Gammaproteobacteria bacterium]|nr:glycerol kinase GlpK [Gammaproteobacteria bacterium]